MASRKLIVEIIGDSRSLEKSFGRIETRSEKLQRRLRTGAKAGLAGAAVVGGAVVVKQLQASVKAARDSEAAQVRLRGAFKRSGATQKDFARAQKEIAKVSRESALDDEDLSDSLANITRTTGSAQKGLKGMSLAANIARARNISLAAATKIVEKAHVGQLRGLKGVGVQIGKNTTSAQALERAQKKFSGAGAEFGRSAAGAQERLNVAFENLQETIGAKLLPVLQRLAIKLTEVIENVEKNWPQIQKVIEDTVRVLTPVVSAITKQVKGIANVIAGVVKTVKAIKNGDWSKAWEGIKQVALDGMLEIVKGVAELPVKILRALGSGAWSQLKRIGTTIKDFALEGLRGLGDAIVATIQSAINRIIRFFNSIIGKINKVSPFGDIGKIPQIGAAQRQGVTTTAAQSATAAVASRTADRPIVVKVEIDGKQAAKAVTVEQQKNGRSNPRQKRGGGAVNVPEYLK